MQDLNDLTFFVEVVRHGGFSAASRASGVDKTRLSRRLAALEHGMQVRLLQRNTRNVALTEAGRLFYEQALAVIEKAQAAFDSMQTLRAAPSGIVRLSCPQVMAQSVVAPLLGRFLLRYPAVSVELRAEDKPPDLLREGWDVSLRAQCADAPPPGMVCARWAAPDASWWPVRTTWRGPADRPARHNFSVHRPCVRRAMRGTARCTGNCSDRTIGPRVCRCGHD